MAVWETVPIAARSPGDDGFSVESGFSKPVSGAPGGDGAGHEAGAGNEAGKALGGGGEVTNERGASLFERLMTAYGDGLMKTPVRILVLLVFFGYGVFCVVLEPRIVDGLPRTSLAPDDSFLLDFFAVFDTVFESQTGVMLEGHFRGFDHSPPAAQARILAAWGIQLGSEYVEDISPIGGVDAASPPNNWLTVTLEMGDALNRTVPCRELGVSPEMCALAAVPLRGVEPRLLPAALFNSTLTLALEGAPDARQSVKRRASDGAVTSSKVHMRAVAVADDYAKQLKIFLKCQALDRRINDELFGGVGAGSGGMPTLEEAPKTFFTFQEVFVFWQQDAFLWSELINNLSYAGTGVFIVCLFGLAHPAALIATAGVGFVDLFLFGSLILGSIRFNVISVINFVMAVGLAVDYTLHFCHAFLATPGSNPVERVKATLSTMGSSILKGGGTTLMGTLPMAFSKSTIFRTFFALLFSTIVYGLAVGLVLIPVVLSIVPLPVAHHLQRH